MIMNTFAESTALPLFIYFKIDLTSEEARQTDAWTKAVAQLPSIFSNHWALMLETDIIESLRERGILARATPDAKNGFTSNLDSKSTVICWKSETIGVFQVTDWRGGIETVKASLQKWRLFQFSKVGWHDPHEVVLRIVHPGQSEELFAPALATMGEWIDNMQRESDVFTNGLAVLEKVIASHQPPPPQ